MLRITVSESPAEQRWVLQGRLSGPWAAQLESCWKSTNEKRRGRGCVVDLTNLTSIDERGEQVLRTMVSEGARFQGCGVYIAHVLENISKQCKGHCR